MTAERLSIDDVPARAHRPLQPGSLGAAPEPPAGVHPRPRVEVRQRGAAEARDPEMTAFMLAEVFPKMAELHGREGYNHDTAPDGFRCVGCHLVAK